MGMDVRQRFCELIVITVSQGGWERQSSLWKFIAVVTFKCDNRHTD